MKLPIQRPNFELEKRALSARYSFVIGCDEVGRGCLAGPVVAASIILNPKDAKAGKGWYQDINDSKKLTPVKRFTLEKLLRQHAISYGIGVVSPAVIDQVNIHNASLLAMKRAVAALQKKISHGTPSSLGKTVVLVDGRFKIPNLEIEQQAIVHGDQLVLSIASASIIAKTYRDRLMTKLDQKFPHYNFAQHKGYATAKHKAALAKHGVSQVHRNSFIHL